MPKRILITGGAGFVGHHCVDHLLKNTDWNIIVLDSLNYAGNMNRITDSEFFTPERVKFIWHDLKAPISETTHKLIGKLDYCIHFAAESHVDRSLEDSIPFVMSNVVGTANLLEYLKHNQPECKTLVFSTDEVFGPAAEGVYFKENDSFKPSNPYSASKAGEEMIAYSFAHAFGLPISIVRSMNIIGERQHPEKFVPKMINAVLNGEKLTLHGTGKDDLSSRCWIHARNVADGLIFLLDKAEKEEFYHIVGEERTVLEIADWICEVIKGRKLKEDEIEWLDYEIARSGHDKRYALSGAKLAKMGWKPLVDLEDSLKKSVKWTLEHQKWLNL
ncbi:MAG: dTDP-glucose 4,6-dehydratase [Candidatus Nealsonbacteria bacterium]